MKVDTLALLEDCIERGVQHAINNHAPCPVNAAALQEAIENEIWLQLDTYFTFNRGES